MSDLTLGSPTWQEYLRQIFFAPVILDVFVSSVGLVTSACPISCVTVRTKQRGSLEAFLQVIRCCKVGLGKALTHHLSLMRH